MVLWGTHPGELLGIPPQIVELGAMRLAHPAYRVVVQDMRARTRLFETLQHLLGAFHHPVEGLGDHGQGADRMPLGNAMVRHGDSLRNRNAKGRLCAHQHTRLPRRLLSQSPSLHHAYDLGKARHDSQRNRGMFTEIAHIDVGHFYPDLAKAGNTLSQWVLACCPGSTGKGQHYFSPTMAGRPPKSCSVG
jgi:hypothetical protein